MCAKCELVRDAERDAPGTALLAVHPTVAICASHDAPDVARAAARRCLGEARAPGLLYAAAAAAQGSRGLLLTAHNSGAL
jgi:hypothetical protein